MTTLVGTLSPMGTRNVVPTWGEKQNDEEGRKEWKNEKGMMVLTDPLLLPLSDHLMVSEKEEKIFFDVSSTLYLWGSLYRYSCTSVLSSSWWGNGVYSLFKMFSGVYCLSSSLFRPCNGLKSIHKKKEKVRQGIVGYLLINSITNKSDRLTCSALAEQLAQEGSKESTRLHVGRG